MSKTDIRLKRSKETHAMRLYKNTEMSDNKFKDKYRVPSARLPDYDYSQEGIYFITICVQGRKCCLGEIKDGEVVLSDLGKIVCDELLKTPKIRHNVVLDEWVIMPNHIHVILEIVGDGVETHCNASLPKGNIFGPQRNNLASIIRGFKGSVIRFINQKFGPGKFVWQTRYYDQIIADEKEYAKVAQYILDNPGKWAEDQENPVNFKNAK